MEEGRAPRLQQKCCSGYGAAAVQLHYQFEMKVGCFSGDCRHWRFNFTYIWTKERKKFKVPFTTSQFSRNSLTLCWTTGYRFTFIYIFPLFWTYLFSLLIQEMKWEQNRTEQTCLFLSRIQSQHPLTTGLLVQGCLCEPPL